MYMYMFKCQECHNVRHGGGGQHAIKLYVYVGHVYTCEVQVCTCTCVVLVYVLRWVPFPHLAQKIFSQFLPWCFVSENENTSLHFMQQSTASSLNQCILSNTKEYTAIYQIPEAELTLSCAPSLHPWCPNWGLHVLRQLY